ncbi:serine hydrolase domain-containing protein [Algibacter mikhailovii]|uniref:Serine hydrolase n=1 Tax=Algibacter mikhailovii TaxID=425498 RepID=A0A918R2B9_9FLAO|nr:serine hydrolase domain-containing protein [Algibacter mikhailovii]GGZ81573.1 serine hydrolase [Algibacter mikhailovii]
MTRILIMMSLFFACFSFGQNIEKTEKQTLKKAKKQAKRFLRSQGIPGMSISVSKKGDLIWSQGFGYANRKERLRVEPNKTRFRIASISKSITAVTLAKLVDDNLIDLNISIYTYLPDYPQKKFDFTVRELAGHLAGIRSYKGDEFTLSKKLSISEGVELFKNDSLLFEPSTQFYYNTYGYVLLSEIMQQVSKTDFVDLVNRLVLQPLNMSNTMLDDSERYIPNKTTFYRNKRVLSTPVANEYKVAGGGFLSTSEDLIKFGQEVISPTLISEDALFEITTSQKLKSGNLTGYGIGFSVERPKNGTPKIYHTGGGIGASTALFIYPKEAIVICVLTNKTGVKMDSFGKTLEHIFID